MNGRSYFAALTSVAMLSVAAGAAAQTADDFPNRPIRIIVPQAAGSGVDLQARVLAQKMGELWGQQGVVENRPGANAIVGMEAAAKAKPDGYTLVYAPVSAVTTNAFIYKKLPYDALRDFAPITQTAANPLGAVVNPASGIKSIKDLVERAKANPGQLNYGSFGIGNMTHLMGVLLSIAADIKMTHVPYRGQTPEITDVLAGQIPLAFTTTAGVTDLVEIGKAQSARHVRRTARRAVSQHADRGRSGLSERGHGRLERVARAGRHAAANHQPIAQRSGAGAGHARRQGRDIATGLEGGEQQQPGRIRALHQIGSAEIPRHHQGRRPGRVAVSGCPYVEKTHRFGLLTPSSNTTQEPEFSAALPPSVSLHTGRVAYRDITPQEQMRCVLELEAESRKLADAEVGAIVFAATAPTLAKGKGYDRELIKRMEDASGKPATTAATAFVDALTRLGAKNIAIGAPWSKTMDKPMVEFMQMSGFKVVHSEVVGFVASIELGRVGPETSL